MQITRTTPLTELPEYLSINEVCTVVNIGRSTAYDLVRQGILPSVRVGVKLVRIPREALVQWLAGEVQYAGK